MNAENFNGRSIGAASFVPPPDPPGSWRRTPDGTVHHRAPGGAVHSVDLPWTRSHDFRADIRQFVDGLSRICAEPWSTKADVATLLDRFVWEVSR